MTGPVPTVTESIPPTVTDDRPAKTTGRQTYDMTVNVAAGVTLNDGVFKRVPPGVLDSMRGYDAVVRLTLDITEG